MSYWRIVFARAWQDAAKSVGLDTGERVLMAILTQAVIALLVYFLLGGEVLKTSEPVRLLASIAPFAMLPVLFLARLSATPGILDRERSDEVARLRAQQETDETIKQRRECIGNLLADATALANAFCSGRSLEEIIPAINDWHQRATEFANVSLDGAERALLWSDAGIICGEPGLSEDRMGRWRWITYRAIRLQQIIGV